MVNRDKKGQFINEGKTKKTIVVRIKKTEYIDLLLKRL